MGSKLKTLRQARGLTQDALAALAKVEQKHISQLERERIADPRWSTVYRLAKALRLRPESVFPVPEP